MLFAGLQVFGQTNDVFFFVTEAGGPPIPFNGATINLTDGGAYDQSIITGADPLGDVFSAVPYGAYTYIITKDCYVPKMGAVTVDANGGMGVSIVDTVTATTSAPVFVSTSSHPIIGAW
ncbi:MAG: hypothetical protein DA407_16885, partial [Bacteroidetes bacterium]